MERQRINIMDDSAVQSPATAQEPPVVQYGAVSERFLALLIDVAFIVFPFTLLLKLYFHFFVPGHYDFWTFTWAVILGNILFLAYETVFSCGDRVTLGKALVGIAVMKQDESGPLSFGRAFLRAVGYYVSAGLFFMGFVWAYFDTRHRALHDLIGGSVVVSVRPKSLGERIFLRAVGTLALAGLCWAFYTQSFGGAHWRENYKIRQAEKFLGQIARLEEAHKRLYGSYTNDFLRLVLLSGDPVQFQRDMNKVLLPKGFKIGVNEDGYKISAHAKDVQKTTVYYTRKL